MITTDILIIGGGFAGAQLAQNLSKANLNVTLVDKKDYFEVTFATLRNLASPQITKNAPRKKYVDFFKGNFIQNIVTQLSQNQAKLKNGDSIIFKKVVIASGSRYPSLSIAKSNLAYDYDLRNQEITAQHQILSHARSVAIIGGGCVGVELAGEISHAFPEKNITLSQQSESLLNGFKPKTQQKALQQLKKLGVKIELNTKYVKTENGYIDEQTGNTIQADIVYESTGIVPNSEFLNTHYKDTLNEEGFIKVDDYLKVIGLNNSYALGDVAQTGDRKMGYLAIQQAKYLSTAIINEINNEFVEAYKRQPFISLVTTGLKKGVAQLPFGVTSLGLVIKMKQKDLFISKMFTGLGTQKNDY